MRIFLVVVDANFIKTFKVRDLKKWTSRKKIFCHISGAEIDMNINIFNPLRLRNVSIVTTVLLNQPKRARLCIGKKETTIKILFKKKDEPRISITFLASFMKIYFFSCIINNFYFIGFLLFIDGPLANGKRKPVMNDWRMGCFEDFYGFVEGAKTWENAWNSFEIFTTLEMFLIESFFVIAFKFEDSSNFISFSKA